MIGLAIFGYFLMASPELLHSASIGGAFMPRRLTAQAPPSTTVDGYRCKSKSLDEIRIFPVLSEAAASTSRRSTSRLAPDEVPMGCISGRFSNEKLVCAPEGGYGLSSVDTGVRYMDLKKGAQLSLFSGPVVMYEKKGRKHHYDGGILTVQQDNSIKNWNNRWSLVYDEGAKSVNLMLAGQGPMQGPIVYKCSEEISQLKQETK